MSGGRGWLGNYGIGRLLIEVLILFFNWLIITTPSNFWLLLGIAFLLCLWSRYRFELVFLEHLSNFEFVCGL